MRWKWKYLLPALEAQLPLKRAFRNFFITGNAWGMFSINSHITNGKEKVKYNTFATAQKSADKMSEKYGKHFSTYFCVYCGKWHLGKNRDNK